MSKRKTTLAAEADRHGGDDPEPEPSRPGDDPDEPQGSRPAVELILQTEDCDPPASRWIEPLMLRVITEAGSDAAITLVLVGDDEMAQMHEQYTGVAGTTDVLTFDHRDRPGDGPVEGDIILCVDEARRQASQRAHDERTELLLYAVHGLLHLLGEDDHDDAAYARMHAREDALLQAVGVGAVFERGGQGNSAKPQAADDDGGRA